MPPWYRSGCVTACPAVSHSPVSHADEGHMQVNKHVRHTVDVTTLYRTSLRLHTTEVGCHSISSMLTLLCQVGSVVQAGGVVPLGDLAAQFGLGSELLMSVISARMNKVIHGRSEGGLLYTSAYIARIKAQVALLQHASCHEELQFASLPLPIRVY